jgi:type I restriction enzyme S subunit
MTNNFLIENFKHLTSTPENVEQLKKLVLQMAVQGNLTAKWRDDVKTQGLASPDDPNYNAHALLEKIKTEKEQLIKEGKIKRQKPSPPIADEEKPFEIPENWVWVKLNDISSVGTGATPLTSNTEYYTYGTIPWISSAATNSLFVTKPDKLITDKALKETNCTLCPIGTLVVAMYGQGKTRGQITELLIEATTNQACATIQLFLNESNLRKYIKFFFLENYEKTRSFAFGGAQPNLNLLKIKNTVIPLPPLAEQQAIVSQVEKLFTQVDQLHALTQKRLYYREKSAKALFNKINHAENDTELQETWQTLTAHFH